MYGLFFFLENNKDRFPAIYGRIYLHAVICLQKKSIMQVLGPNILMRISVVKIV